MLKAMTRQEIADKIGIHRNTLSRKCKEANIILPNRTLIMPKIHKTIFKHFGIKIED